MGAPGPLDLARTLQEQQETQRAAAYSIAMHAAEQTSHDRAHVQGGTRNNTQHGRHTPATTERVARNTAAPIPSETHRPSKKEPRECTTKLKAHGSPKATAQAQQSITEKQALRAGISQRKRLRENSEEFNILYQ